MNITIHDNWTAEMAERLGMMASEGERILANEIMKDTEPFVPALTGKFNQMAHTSGSMIIYSGPQARYLWHGKRMVNAKTGKGPRKIPNVGYRWPLGATLVATDTPLKFTRGMHPYAQSHWFEASREQNMEKWKRIAAKLVTDGNK